MILVAAAVLIVVGAVLEGAGFNYGVSAGVARSEARRAITLFTAGVAAVAFGGLLAIVPML